ncbi:hypothetical protein J6590_088345 [Homalodisca vitripennis]|nr:hypothetical protein J6590_088345 [Homalodisca vitripennis]
MDPLTELSSQTVILPQTPCNSFLSGPHLHQVSAASHVITSTRYLVDPLVELSSQTVILPQTPCNSFSLVHIYTSLVTMSGLYVLDPWWSSPPRQSSYLKLPATTYLWSTSTLGQCR